MVILRVKELGVDTLLKMHGKEDCSRNTRRIDLHGRHELEVLSSEGFKVVVHVVVGSGRRWVRET